jgi:hypothetical protein
MDNISHTMHYKKLNTKYFPALWSRLERKY